LGSENYGGSFKPGLLLRYGRWSISSNGSFAARTDDPNDLPRGMGLNLLGDEHDWVKLSLRVDSGRRSTGIKALRGVDDVPRTLRLRLAARNEWGDGWVITPGVNIDLLNKGVGHTADLSVAKDWPLTSKLKVSVSTGLTWATGHYMRSYFGITPLESAASGYAVYEPGSGLRDLRLGTGLRYDINKHWVAVAHASVQSLVGQAASSPTTQAATQWGVGAGLGWRF
jgi:MipA family protein